MSQELYILLLLHALMLTFMRVAGNRRLFSIAVLIQFSTSSCVINFTVKTCTAVIFLFIVT
jgi:hypothetical protein